MTIQANFPNVQPSLLLDFANAKQLPPSVNFTRATTAAYYDGSTTAMAEQNLVTQSQAFNLWGLENIAVSADSTTAPDGTTTADTITATGSNINHSSYSPNAISVTAGLVYTFSVYAKKNGSNFVQLAWYPGQFGNAYANFDLNAGTAGTASGCTSTITNVGNGWYRCTMTATCASSGTSYVYYCIVTSSTAGIFEAFAPTTQSIYLWGYQFEQRSTATAYTVTTTQTITNYIPVLLTAGGGQPRFDHNPTTGESLGLLIEEQRTNVGLYSSDFSNATWAKGNSTIDADTIVAPDGTLTGDKLVETTATGSHNIVQNYTGTATLTASVYAKPSNRSIFVFNGGNQSGVAATFNVSSGTVSSVGGSVAATSITPVGNGWYRCSMTWSNTSTVGLGIFLESGGSTSYTGDGFSGLFIWGAQIETGSFPTSYIPTTSAAATRATDAAVMTGNNLTSWFNNSEGTLYGEASFPASAAGGGASKGVANLGNTVGPTQNSMALYYSPTLNQSTFEVVNGVAQATFTANFFNKLAGAYKFNDSNLGYGGSSGTTDTSCTIPVCDQFVIGNVYSSTQIYQTNGWIRKIAYYPVRVTNAQLQALTS